VFVFFLFHRCRQQERSSSFLSLCLQNNVRTWHAPADRCSPEGLCRSILMPLFAQRLRDIIGTNARNYSYLCTHTRAQKASAGKCAPGAAAYVHTGRALQTLCRFLSSPTPCPVWFPSGGSRPLTAGSGRCDSAGKAHGDKSVSAAAPFVHAAFHSPTPPPLLRQSITCSSRKQTLDLSTFNSYRTITPPKNLAQSPADTGPPPFLQT